MDARFNGLITSCSKCDNYGYYSGGTSHCRLVEQAVQNPSQVASFCPLPRYPSEEIAGLMETVRAYQEQHKNPMQLMMLANIATKLRLPLDARGKSITFNLKDGDKKLVLDVEYITGIDYQSSTVYFKCPGDPRRYRLRPDARPPELQMDVHVPGHENEEFWDDVSVLS